jgi:hypothetical protein
MADRWKVNGVISYSAETARDQGKTDTMRISNAVLVAAISFAPLVACMAQGPSIAAHGQSSTAAPTAAAAPASSATSPPGAPPAAPPLPPPSGLLQPSLDSVQQTLGSLRVEKWKRGSVRDEANQDISSLVKDMQSNLPPLLKDADGGPGTLSKVLPLAKHVDALYDVLLRVVEAARMSAPDDQTGELRQALSNLGSARLALDDQMQQAAATQEKQLTELRVTVEKQAAFKCPAPPPAPECPKAPAKKVVKRKPNPAPTTTTPPGTAPKTPQATPQKAPPAANGTTPKTGP